MTIYPLYQMPIGKIGLIKEINSLDLPKPMLTELLELGFFPGAKIILESKSEALGKIICSIGNTKIGLRLEDAKSIFVSPNS